MKRCDDDLLHLSPSSLAQLSRCGVQWHFVHNLRLRVPPGIALIVGSGVHVSAAANLSNKAALGEPIPLDAARDAARDAVLGRWDSEGVLLAPEEETRGESVLRGEAVDKAVGLSTLHHVKVAPTIQPTAVERRFEIRVANRPLLLTGVIDCESETEVWDHKTSTKAPAANVADMSEQLTAYALAKHALDQRAPERLHLDYLIETKGGKVNHERRSTVRAVEDFTPYLNRVAAAEQVIRRGAFMPANPERDWWCSERFCGFARTGKCPYYRVPKVIPAAGLKGD